MSSPFGGLAPMCLRCCGCIPDWFLSMSLVCGHVGRRRAHTARWWGPWYTAGANGGATLLGTMVPARLCVSIAVVQPTLVTPDGRGGLGDEGTILRHSFVGLCCCGDGSLWPVVRYIMATPHCHMTIPVVEPTGVPLPSLGHRKICVAGLARGHP